MKIQIVNRYTPAGQVFFEWDLWDGPADSSDHAHGYASDLPQAFTKIFEWHERIENDYTNPDKTNDETNLSRPSNPEAKE